GARIATSANYATAAGGNITVIAGRDIQLNGIAQAPSIRTTGDVTLQATKTGGTISEDAGSSILARGLTATSDGSISLAGANAVSSFTATSTAGDISLSNTGALAVSPISAWGNA